MLSFKEWKSLNESYDFSLGLATPAVVGLQNQSGFPSFAELLEAKKKMKKKMFGDEEVSSDEEIPDEEEEVEADDAETGDGEVVEPSAPKDEEPAEEGDEEAVPVEKDKEAFIARMKKKMKSKMKKKMAAEGTESEEELKSEETELEAETSAEDAWFQSVKSMMTYTDSRNDGLTDYTKEDALMPYIDPNTGLTSPTKPGPGEVGYAPFALG